MTDADWEDIKYFKQSEMRCRDGCGISNPKKALMERLDRARERADIPFVIHSGSRCEKHNKEVGGVDSSAHLATLTEESSAVDIGARGSRQRYLIIKSLLDVGFLRIGIAKTFIHTDIDPTKDPEVAWLY